MNKKFGTTKDAADKLIKGIKRNPRKHYSAEEKIRILLAAQGKGIALFQASSGTSPRQTFALQSRRT